MRWLVLRVAHIAASDMTLSTLLLNQLARYRDAGFDVAGISARGPHVPELDVEGVRFFEVPFTRTFGPFADLRAMWALWKILRREKFDIIHTHTPKGGLLGQWAAFLARVPIRVHTIHGLYFPASMRANQRWIYVWLERLSLAFSHYNFSQNPEDVPVAIDERIVSANRIELVGNGIALSRFDPSQIDAAHRTKIRAQLGLSDDHLVVGMVGRLVAEKGYLEAFEAVRMLKARVPQARFIFIGGFEDKPDAISANILAARGIEDTAQLLGHRSDLVELYAAMDVFMLPSHREGWPRSVMEAAAMGKPCVVTDIRGCRQTVDHEQTGLIVPPHDPEALAGALERLLRSPSERASMGQSGRLKALVEFDERKVIDAIIRTYRRLALELR